MKIRLNLFVLIDIRDSVQAHSWDEGYKMVSSKHGHIVPLLVGDYYEHLLPNNSDIDQLRL
jgi:hypothetical protein